MKSLLVGCSNLVGEEKNNIWSRRLDCDQIVNLSIDGAGNQYIAGRTIEYLLSNKADYVYLQFSGIHRIDQLLTSSSGLKLYPHVVSILDNKYWILSGGKYGSWKEYNVTRQLFMSHYITDNTDALVFQSLMSVYACINVLETLNIPYNYTFYYNIFEPACDYIKEQEGTVPRDNFLHNEKFLNSFPHDYCYAHNGIVDDRVHFKNVVYTQWTESLKLEVDK